MSFKGNCESPTTTSDPPARGVPHPAPERRPPFGTECVQRHADSSLGRGALAQRIGARPPRQQWQCSWECTPAGLHGRQLAVNGLLNSRFQWQAAACGLAAGVRATGGLARTRAPVVALIFLPLCLMRWGSGPPPVGASQGGLAVAGRRRAGEGGTRSAGCVGTCRPRQPPTAPFGRPFGRGGGEGPRGREGQVNGCRWICAAPAEGAGRGFSSLQLPRGVQRFTRWEPPPLPLLQKGCGVPPSPRVASTPTPCGTPGGRRGDAPPTLLLWGTPYPQAPPAASRAALWAVPPPVAPPINGDAAPRRRVYARGGCSPPSTRPLAPLSCFPSGHRPCPVHRATPPRTPPSTPVPSSRRRPPPLVSRRYTPVR